ncbi:Uncharacterised protein [Photobacterium damselae]|uniref:Uncharacterized protein n=1 Tax=Photobacterium damselae TaxID=38293 RepID=A0A2X1ZL54_PHODM|nr:Uncharacterised protein [Photobacterium damselae]
MNEQDKIIQKKLALKISARTREKFLLAKFQIRRKLNIAN